MHMPKVHPSLLHPDETILVILDLQQSLFNSIHNANQLLKNVSQLINGVNILRIPVICTTQSQEKLGALLPDIAKMLPPFTAPYDKISFSAMANSAFASHLHRQGRKQILLCGVEAHICVSQTAHELLCGGYQVQVASDGVSSRTEANWHTGLNKMRQSGILLTSVEMALYELMQEADTPEFREVLKLIR